MGKLSQWWKQFKEKEATQKGGFYYWFRLKIRTNLNATCRGQVARDGWTERNNNFRQRRKCKSSPVTVSVLRVLQQDIRHHLTGPERVILGRFFLDSTKYYGIIILSK